MDFLQILKVICAVGTLATGLFALLRPLAVRGFTGLETPGPRGVTELRTIMGGLFMGLGVAPLLLPVPAAFQMLGIAYVSMAAVRAVSIVMDHSAEPSNNISLVVEVVFGVILVV